MSVSLARPLCRVSGMRSARTGRAEAETSIELLAGASPYVSTPANTVPVEPELIGARAERHPVLADAPRAGC